MGGGCILLGPTVQSPSRGACLPRGGCGPLDSQAPRRSAHSTHPCPGQEASSPCQSLAAGSGCAAQVPHSLPSLRQVPSNRAAALGGGYGPGPLPYFPAVARPATEVHVHMHVHPPAGHQCSPLCKNHMLAPSGASAHPHITHTASPRAASPQSSEHHIHRDSPW